MDLKPNQDVQVKYTKIFFNNEWLNSASGRVFPVENPSTAEKICDVQEGDKVDVEKAVEAAKNAFKPGSPWRTMDASDRGRLLYKLADLIERDSEYIAKLQTLENGKPFRDSLKDLERAISSFRYFGGCADKLHGKTIPADGPLFTYTRLEPVGVCGIIIPWNFPVPIISQKLGAALAAGNVTVVKPSELAPLTTIYLASLVKEVGFPPGVVNIVPGYGPTAGEALTSSFDVEKISFSGSTKVGKRILETAGKTNLKNVTLALGGKCPLVVCPDFDVGEAAEIAHSALFAYMGQRCCSASRTLVHEDIYDDFVARSKALAQAKVIGDPFSEETAHGPQIDENQVTKILDFIESGKKEGARLECGGSRHGSKGCFVQPTVFSQATNSMRIAKKEIFGPVMLIMKFKSLDEAIEISNDSDYGLVAGILTNDLNTAIKYSHEVRASSIWVNNYSNDPIQSPAGAFKMSGLGKEDGNEALYEYSVIKSVSIKVPEKNS